MAESDNQSSQTRSSAALDFLQPLETRTRGVAVLDALADMIDRGGLNIGDRLPPEIVLAQHLGVGRSTIREALNRWEGLGLIKRKRGAGTFLAAKVQSSRGLVPTMIRLEGEALLRLLEVRRALEVVVCRKAALNATADQRKLVEANYWKLIKLVDAGKEWRKADAEFHGAIYDASGNPMFGQLLTNLDDALQRSPESPFGRTEFGLESFPLHRILCDGVVEGNADLAADGINQIIDSVAAEIRSLIDLQAE